MVGVKTIAYAGWNNCVCLDNDKIKIIITTDVGPRIIYCGPSDKELNVFHQRQGQQGQVNAKEWMIYGGHRLWHSPQDAFRPNQVDNAPVFYKTNANSVEMEANPETETKVQKQLFITIADEEPWVMVRHRIFNRGLWPIQIATWGMSCMHDDGLTILPIPQEQTPDYYPNFSVTYWPWTKPNDSRFVIGEKFMTLRQEPENKQWFKIAYRNTENWGAYLYKGYLFVKIYPLDKNAAYPDFNSSFAVYTDNDMVELETMGPLNTVVPGGFTEHIEEWYLYGDVAIPADEKEIEQNIAAKVRLILQK
jgi:hypothetical protein